MSVAAAGPLFCFNSETCFSRQRGQAQITTRVDSDVLFSLAVWLSIGAWLPHLSQWAIMDMANPPSL